MTYNEAGSDQAIKKRHFLVFGNFYYRILDSIYLALEYVLRGHLLPAHNFDDDWYLENNPDVMDYNKGSLFKHFQKHGQFEGRSARFFDAGWYLKAHRDARFARMNAWSHYKLFGMSEGRSVRFNYVKNTLMRGKAPPFRDWVKQYDTRSLGDVNAMRKIEQTHGINGNFDVVIYIDEHSADQNQIKSVLAALKNQIFAQTCFYIGVSANLDIQLRNIIYKTLSKDGRFLIKEIESFESRNKVHIDLFNLGDSPYVLILTSRDILDVGALFWMAYQCHLTPNADIIYADDDVLSADAQRSDPWFKPQFNYELFLSHNYIGDAFLARRELLSSLIGSAGDGFEWSAYEILWRAYDIVGSKGFAHIPRILNHIWNERDTEKSDAKVLKERFQRVGLKAEILSADEAIGYTRVRHELPAVLPLVSIIIPTRDRLDLLRMTVETILAKTKWANYEVLIVDNGSIDPDTLAYLAAPPDSRIRVIRDPRPFNFSALNNGAVSQAAGEYICLMNNDIEVITPDWLEEMMSFAIQPDVGCVGARLWYPDDTIQHAGVLIGFHGVAGHMHKFLPKGETGYANRAVLHQSLSAVTAAVLVVRKEIYHEVGGLEETLAVAFNDVDFCLKVRDAGYRNVYTPYAEMYHHESASRGTEDTPEKKRREQMEIDFIKAKYGEVMMQDPAYNPNLTLVAEDMSCAFPPRVKTVNAILLEAL